MTLLDETKFHQLVDELQQHIEDVLDNTGLDVDIINAGGVLTIRFENGSQLVLSRQPPLKQLWVAAKSGGYHLDYNKDHNDWFIAATNESIHQLLQRVVKEQTSEQVGF